MLAIPKENHILLHRIGMYHENVNHIDKGLNEFSGA